MRDLDYYGIMCIRELEIIGIQPGNITKFIVNTRAKSRWGQCKRLPNRTFEININSDLLRDDIPIDGLKSTLYHEILHTCDGCMNHGEKWTALAAKVTRYYGVKVSRTDSALDKGFSKEQAQAYEKKRTAKAKYKFVCDGCGQEITYMRAGDHVKHPERYRCVFCHSNFTRVA